MPLMEGTRASVAVAIDATGDDDAVVMVVMMMVMKMTVVIIVVICCRCVVVFQNRRTLGFRMRFLCQKGINTK